MTIFFPCELAYYIEEEIEISLKCPALSSLEYALDRFRQDEERIGVGLMARLTTLDSGFMYIGCHSRKSAAFLSYASPQSVLDAGSDLPRARSVLGNNRIVGIAEFHLFYPDCPAYVSEYQVLDWPLARQLVLQFAELRYWSAEVLWFDA